MLSGSVLLLLAAAAYMALLFAIACFGDRRADAGRSLIDQAVRLRALARRSTATSWTFYGSVGRAAASGIGFLPIYLGPTLVVLPVAGSCCARSCAISKANRITSIADFIARATARARRSPGSSPSSR